MLTTGNTMVKQATCLIVADCCSLAPRLILELQLLSFCRICSPWSNFKTQQHRGAAHQRRRPRWAIVASVGAAVEGLTRELALELAPMQVKMMHPGAVETEVVEGLPAEMYNNPKEVSLTKRHGRPKDVAEAYLYIMKDHSADKAAIRPTMAVF
jgi:NAD(P)-dependent dehydrogenase (short-subunit alcohol dehydrogenase family)